MNRPASLLMVVLLSSASLSPAQNIAKPSYHTEGTPNGKSNGPLQPGQYWWAPRISPDGPVMILVSLPKQEMNVYRNGILIARSSISSGMPGHSTPTGVFTILEKNSEHYSKKYNNAPMPYMERLTWDGVAFHSGFLPGHAASHGCIRLPFEFSKKLFDLTKQGGTVVIGDHSSLGTSYAADPGAVLPGIHGQWTPLPSGAFHWHPERSPSGPVAIVLSSGDRMIYVYRNGVRIGKAGIRISGIGGLGNDVFTWIVQPGSIPPTGRWMSVGHSGKEERAIFDILSRRVVMNEEFQRILDGLIVSGTTVIVSDLPVSGKKEKQVRFLGI